MNSGSILFIVLVIFLCASFIQLLYFWLVFSRLAFYKHKQDARLQLPVSVVVCARNEYHHLQENLPLILAQDYPDYEVVVVNDCSEDDTLYLLQDLSKQYRHLKIVNITSNVNFFSGKKFPLSMGIKSATHDIVLLTDADCKPTGNQWIAAMQRNFTEGKEIVLGFSPYRKTSGLLNLLVRYDTFITALQYLSFSLSGLTYMGVGRNLSYKKSLFYQHKGFTKHYQVKSGDDDLFINKAATRRNTAIEISPESHTYSPSKDTFSKWFWQKKRHLSTAPYYKFKFQFLLGLYPMSTVIFLATFVVLAIYKYQPIAVYSVFAGRYLCQLFVFKKSLKKLNQKELLLTSPILEMLFLVLNPVFALMNIVIKENKWK